MSALAPRTLSLRTTLFLAFLLVAALPIALLSVQRYYSMTEQFFQEELNQDVALARSVAGGLQRYMSLRRYLVDTLAQELAGRELRDVPALSRELDVVRRRNPAFRTLAVLDRSGVAKAFSPGLDDDGRPNVGRRYDDRDWFQRLLKGVVEPSANIVFGRAQGGRPTVVVAAPIMGAAGEVVGAVAGGLDVDEIRRSVHDVDPAVRDRLVVVDGHGRVIAHQSEEWERTAHDLSREGIFATAQRQPEGILEYTSTDTGDKRWGSFVRVPAAGWFVWASRGPDAWAAKVRALARDLAISGVAAILIVAAVAFFVSDALSRPLRSLAAAIEDVAARRFGNGETGQRNSPILEFDQLLTGFGEMTETLRAQYEDLEAKVSERTRKLGKAMRAAQRTAALARAEDEIRRGYAELAALLNSLDRSLILHEGSRKIAASLKAPLTAVYLTDSDVEHLRLKTFAALDATALDAHLLAPTGLPAEAARRGEAIVLSLAQAAEPLRLGTGVGTVDVAAVAALPLQSSDRLLGVLVVAVLEPLTEPTRAFLANAARQLSVALTNASLFESVRYQSQQLEELNRELRRASEVKSQFLASMSHELRTPLNSILGFTEILLASARDPLSPRQRTAIEKVLGSGRHLLSLINDVLDLSKIEAGRLEAQPEHFGLAALLQECLASVEPQAAAKGLALRGVGLGQAPEVVQDRAKVKQVVLNLLSNAVKFTSEGSVELRVPPERGGIVEIAVADTGIGIAAEDQAMVFEAFRQVDGTATRENGGTGLGLAISRRLAGLLGGSLGIESVPAHGSTFTVRLPVRCPSSPLVADPGAMPAIGGATPAPGGAGPDVLVIDDDRNAVDLIREAVADSGLTVEWAPAATDGLARARTRRPRLILLDLLLHGHDDGWDLLQMLKTDRATCDIPVVVHSVIDNPQRAQQLGAEGVLAKPASPAAVRALLRQFLEEATPSAVAARR